jgi:hypothetical protein
MLLSRRQNAGQNHDIKIGNRWFENVAQFRYLGTTIRNQNLIQEEIKGRLNLGNACYRSIQNLFPSRLLSKNVEIRIFCLLFYMAVTLGLLTLREAHRLRVFENRVLRRIFGPKRTEVEEFIEDTVGKARSKETTGVVSRTWINGVSSSGIGWLGERSLRSLVGVS